MTGVLATMNGPTGSWRSTYTVVSGRRALSNFLHWLHSNGHSPESIAAIPAGLWNSWVLHSGDQTTAWRSQTIGTLKVFFRHARGASPGLIEAVNRRTWSRPESIQESYSEEEFRKIRRRARKTVHAATRRISANYELLLRHQSGEPISPNERAKADALAELFETGEVSTTSSYKVLGAYQKRLRQRRILQKALCLSPDEAWAAVVLLAAEAGWNWSVIDRLTLPENSIGAGEDVGVFSVQIHKPRQGSRQHSTSNVLSNSDLGRALTWIIAATEPARAVLEQAGAPSQRLIVYGRWFDYRPDDRYLQGIPGRVRRKCQRCSGTKSQRCGECESVNVSLQKVRRTRQVLFDRTPAQNTRKTHDDVYVRNDQSTHDRAHDVIEAGLHDALARAEKQVHMTLLRSETQADAKIQSGTADTVIAGCLNFDSNPTTGRRCLESFLSCLACTNAVATPRHLPRIVTLHSALEELSSALGEQEWQDRWESHYLRLCVLLDRHTTDAERSAAAKQATDSDRAAINRLLSGGLSAE